jgi:cytochrome c5
MKQLTMIVALLFAGIATADDHLGPATKAIYDRSCGFCHTSGAAGAPKTGDAAAWESRMALGMDGFRFLVRLLIALDFPAFERPAKATSQPRSGGH